MMRSIAVVLVVVASACGPSSRGDGNQTPVAHLELSPPDLSVTIVDGAAVTQPYTATLVDAIGARSDVTSHVVFVLRDTGFGNWTGTQLTITGAGAGPTRVVATDGTVMGDTGLTVYVKGSRND